MKIRLLFIILLIPAVAAAQYPSVRGFFEVDEKSGCAPFTITITDANVITVNQCTGANPCDMDWDDNTLNQNTFTHTFNLPGTYVLKVQYQIPFGADSIVIIVVPNIQPTFDIFTCSGNEVQVRVTDLNYDSYIIDYNDPSPDVIVPRGVLAFDEHAYAASPVLRTVSVRGKNSNADDNCTKQDKNVSLQLTLPAPTIDLVNVTNATQIDLNFIASQNTLYRLEIGVNAGAFQNLGNYHDVSTATVPGLNTENNFYCFRLGAVDPCNGNTPTYSTTICSADFNATAQNNQNALSWVTSAAGITGFSLNRDAGLLTPLPQAATSYNDNAVDCNIRYCYQLISHYGTSRSISLEKCITAISTDIPTRIENVSAVVGSSNVELTWVQDPAFETTSYTIFRESPGVSFNPLATSATTEYRDNEYGSSKEYHYRIDYSDVCGNQSPTGIDVEPIILENNSTNSNTISLSWGDYQGWINGVDHYEVHKYPLEGTTPEIFPVALVTTFTDTDLDEQGYRYQIIAIPNDPLDNSVSNLLTVIRELRFAYPRAFTPDNQGPVENEVFKVFVTEEFIADFEMKIFNRWGELIFTTRDFEKGWDGKFKGTPMPEGTYAFTAVLKDKTGKTYKRDGSVVLLRKK